MFIYKPINLHISLSLLVYLKLFRDFTVRKFLNRFSNQTELLKGSNQVLKKKCLS